MNTKENPMRNNFQINTRGNISSIEWRLPSLLNYTSFKTILATIIEQNSLSLIGMRVHKDIYNNYDEAGKPKIKSLYLDFDTEDIRKTLAEKDTTDQAIYLQIHAWNIVGAEKIVFYKTIGDNIQAIPQEEPKIHLTETSPDAFKQYITASEELKGLDML